MVGPLVEELFCLLHPLCSEAFARSFDLPSTGMKEDKGEMNGPGKAPESIYGPRIHRQDKIQIYGPTINRYILDLAYAIAYNVV